MWWFRRGIVFSRYSYFRRFRPWYGYPFRPWCRCIGPFRFITPFWGICIGFMICLFCIWFI